MESSIRKVPDEKQYIQDFIDERVERNTKDGQHMPISEHPAIIQDKLRAITKEQFGYSLFKE